MNTGKPPAAGPRHRLTNLTASTLRLTLGAALALALLLLAAAGWLLATESGLRAALALAGHATAGQFNATSATGRFGGPLRIERIDWRAPGQHIAIRELHLDWRPAALLQGRLDIEALRAESLRLTLEAAPPPEPETAPQTLRLPLALRVGELAVERIFLGKDESPRLTQLHAALESDGRHHRLDTLRLTSQGLQFDASAELDGAAPLPFKGRLHVRGGAHGGFEPPPEVVGNPVEKPAEKRVGKTVERTTATAPDEAAAQTLELQLQADGPLARLPVTGQLASRNSQGRLAAIFTPFDRQPLAHLKARIEGLNPAQWHPQAPQAMLDLEIDIRPGGDEAGGNGHIAGHFHVNNRNSGPIDRQALPLENLAARLRWQGERLQLSGIDARLPGDGRLGGEGEFNFDFEKASGSGNADEAGSFHFRGKIVRLDPARLSGDLPPARISGDFEAAGRFADPPAFNARFSLEESRIAGKPLRGTGRFAAGAGRLHDIDLRLAAGGNRLRAEGALGGAGDELRLDIDAPHLADLGLGLNGDLRARLTLAGTLRAPRATGGAESRHLALPGLFRLSGLRLETRMGRAPEDPMMLRLEFAQFIEFTAPGNKLNEPEAPERPQRTRGLGATRLDISGSLARHRLTLASQLSLPSLPALHNAPLQLTANGGEADGPAWSGTLESLELGKEGALLRLATPAALRLGETLRFGPARFTGSLGPDDSGANDEQSERKHWLARIDSLEHQNGQWKSSGAIEALPVAPLAAALENSSLRLDAAWALTLGDKAQGHFAITRRSGDIQFDAAGDTALGLDDLRLKLELDGQPRLELHAHGQRLGQVRGDIALAPEEPLSANWNGTLRASMADLSWLGPLLAPGLQTGGRLQAEARLGGTPQQPRIDGRLDGERLHLHELESGLRLESGTLQLAFSESALQLESLHFASPHTPLPEALGRERQAALAPIVASPGRLEGKGRLQFDGDKADGQLEFRLERLGVMQRPRQWVALSGEARLGLTGVQAGIDARLTVDGGYWQLADLGAPSLSDDVTVRRGSDPSPAPRTARTRLDLSVDMGRQFHFSGAGVDTRLLGALRLQGEGAADLRASGNIRTAGGRFDAYGQKLDIERGILSFNGLVNNPGLNIRAMRRNQPVEAGVSITGTARRPIIALVSEPPVPDAEKLSWLVFGEALDQGGGIDYGTLLTAASTILGGEDGGGAGKVLRDIQETLGVNVSMGGSSQGGGPRSQVADSSGFGPGGGSASSQVLRVGARLARGLSLSYEQSLTGAESVVKLTLALSRRLSLVGQAGTDNAIDLFYNFRFGGSDTRPRR